MKIKYLVILLSILAFLSSNADNNHEFAKKKKKTKASKGTEFVIHTSFGDMKGRLYDETPLHKANFIKLINEGFYDSLLFHRVIKNFMIQGGDPDSKNAPAGKQLGNGGPGYTIPAEINPKFIHKKGALSAARMGDNVNPQKASSGSQFYIVQGVVYNTEHLAGMEQKIISRQKSGLVQAYIKLPENIELRSTLDSLSAAKNQEALNQLWNQTKEKSEAYYKENGSLGFSKLQKELYSTIGGTPHLDGEYTVFGEIYEGLEIIDLIANVKGDRSNRPIEDVVFSIEILKKK